MKVKSFAHTFPDDEKKEILTNTMQLQEKTKTLIAATKQLNAAPQVTYHSHKSKQMIV